MIIAEKNMLMNCDLSNLTRKSIIMNIIRIIAVHFILIPFTLSFSTGFDGESQGHRNKITNEHTAETLKMILKFILSP